nr:MAG TPA: hypothetical protein [Caudoviricetes sp.]
MDNFMWLIHPETRRLAYVPASYIDLLGFEVPLSQRKQEPTEPVEYEYTNTESEED